MNAAEPTAGEPPDDCSDLHTRRSGGHLHRNVLWRFLHIVLGPVFYVWCPVRAVGLENIDNSQGGLFLLNHESFIDPLVAAVHLRRPVSFLARDSLFRIPLIGTILRKTYVIPISRTAFRGSSVRTAVERVEQGFLIGIFPEGTRSPPGEPGTFRPGFLSLARRIDAPVYPVRIEGTGRVLPRGSWFLRPRRITVTYGSPLNEAETKQLRESDDLKAIADMIRTRVLEAQKSSSLSGG